MANEKLLSLYRKKRAADGLNGRTWDATKHLKYDKEIELEESRHLTSQSSRRDDTCPFCGHPYYKRITCSWCDKEFNISRC